MPRASRTEDGDAAVGDRDGVRSRHADIASGLEEAARDNWHAALRSSTTNPATDLSAFDVEAVADFQRVDARLGRCRARRHHDRGTQGRGEYRVHTVDGHDTEVNTKLGRARLTEKMTELELMRTPGDRRRYALEGIGTIHLEGLFARSANAEAGSNHWQYVRSGFWQRVMQATDAAGNIVGAFRPRDLRRGGTLEWAGREFTLRPASSWRERYALADGDEELVILDGKSWGRRPGLREHPRRPSRRTGAAPLRLFRRAPARGQRRERLRGRFDRRGVEHVGLAPAQGPGESRLLAS